MSSRFDAHLAPGLARKVCQTVLFHYELIGSARISECCRTSKHPRRLPASADPSACATLERLRHSHQLKGATSILWTKNKLSSLCNCVWLCCIWILSRKNSVPVSPRKSLQYTLLSETSKRQIFFTELQTRGKAFELFVLLEVCMSPVVLRHVGVEVHLLCGFQDQATVLFVVDT